MKKNHIGTREMQIEISNYNGKHSMNRFRPLFRALRLVLLSLSALSFISTIVMPYCEGRENSIWVVPPLLPAEIVPLLVSFLSTAILLVYLIHSLIKNRDVLESIWTFLVSMFLFIGSFSINHQRIYLSGFKNYAKDILTAEEWRSISRFAQTHLNPGDYVSEVDITFDDRQQKFWQEFTNQTQIQKLSPDATISVPDRGTTMIEWGGALVGHRAVIIYSNTNDISPPGDVFTGPLFFVPDIAVYIENN
jgi:hypothetical protein